MGNEHPITVIFVNVKKVKITSVYLLKIQEKTKLMISHGDTNPHCRPPRTLSFNDEWLDKGQNIIAVGSLYIYLVMMIQQSHNAHLQLQKKQFSPAIYFKTDSIGLLRYIEKDSLCVCLYLMV